MVSHFQSHSFSGVTSPDFYADCIERNYLKVASNVSACLATRCILSQPHGCIPPWLRHIAAISARQRRESVKNSCEIKRHEILISQQEKSEARQNHTFQKARHTTKSRENCRWCAYRPWNNNVYKRG